jgi:hypothetical protein
VLRVQNGDATPLLVASGMAREFISLPLHEFKEFPISSCISIVAVVQQLQIINPRKTKTN